MVSRRSFITKSAVATAAAIITPSLLSRNVFAAENSPLNGKKVLFVWGGWMGHEPDKCREIFVPWMKSEGAEVTYSTLKHTTTILRMTLT
jgi:hypothetical protein